MRDDGSDVTTVVRFDLREDFDPVYGFGPRKPAWSPDGNRIAFMHPGDGKLNVAQIFVVNADGSDLRRLTREPDGERNSESDPAWSPDGSRSCSGASATASPPCRPRGERRGRSIIRTRP